MSSTTSTEDSKSTQNTVLDDKTELPYTEDEEIIKQIQDDTLNYFNECKKYSMHFYNGEPSLNDKSTKDFKSKTLLYTLYEKHMSNKKKYKNIRIIDSSIYIFDKNDKKHSFHNMPGYILLSMCGGAYSIYKTYYMNGEQFNMYGPSYIVDDIEYYRILETNCLCAKHIVDEFKKLNDINNEQKEKIKELESNDNNAKVKELESILSAQNIVLANKDKLIEELQNKLVAQNNILAEVKKDEPIILTHTIETKLVIYKFYYNDITKVVKKIEINKGDKLSEYIPNYLIYPFKRGCILQNGVKLYFRDDKLHNDKGKAAVIHADGDEEYWNEGECYGVLEKSKLK